MAALIVDSSGRLGELSSVSIYGRGREDGRMDGPITSSSRTERRAESTSRSLRIRAFAVSMSRRAVATTGRSVVLRSRRASWSPIPRDAGVVRSHGLGGMAIADSTFGTWEDVCRYSFRPMSWLEETPVGKSEIVEICYRRDGWYLEIRLAGEGKYP